MKFLGKTIRGSYDKQARSKQEEGYQMDAITYAKEFIDVGTVNAYICVQVGRGRSKNWLEGAYVLNE